MEYAIELKSETQKILKLFFCSLPFSLETYIQHRKSICAKSLNNEELFFAFSYTENLTKKKQALEKISFSIVLLRLN